SFAGQHETVLDVGGVDAIVDALLECWRSVYSDRAAVYRRQRGITGTPRIAVLVQLMVPADASAIAFSADPVSGARDVVVVNAARGLGDAIASGTITPDSYTVRKSDLAIASRITANGGVLPDRDIAGIARLAMQLEKVMGGPVDIECALRDGELHLLQCRPITTLADEVPVTWDDPEDAQLTWTREDAHFDSVFAPRRSDRGPVLAASRTHGAATTSPPSREPPHRERRTKGGLAARGGRRPRPPGRGGREWGGGAASRARRPACPRAPRPHSRP